MPDDSAWRQWKGAVRDLAAAEARVKQTQSYWVQNMLAQFELRRHAADLDGLDIRDPKVLLTLGVPCIDCHTIAGPRTGHKVTFGGPQNQFPVWAECGMAPIDPTVANMPTPPETAK
jgi:hypothetical protein